MKQAADDRTAYAVVLRSGKAMVRSIESLETVGRSFDALVRSAIGPGQPRSTASLLDAL